MNNVIFKGIKQRRPDQTGKRTISFSAAPLQGERDQTAHMELSLAQDQKFTTKLIFLIAFR